MANLGFQTLYGYLTSRPDTKCGTFFTDRVRDPGSGAGAGESDVVALSLSFEGDYPAVPAFLKDAGLAPSARDRDDGHPLVVAGGIAPSLNPEPLAHVADVVYTGEAESGFERLHLFFLHNRGLGRAELLKRLARTALPGVYVPSAYEVTEEGRRIVRTPLHGAPANVEIQRAAPGWPPARTAVVAKNDAFNGAFLIEISRGCPHACRFCAAGHMTRPFRPVPFETLIPLIDEGLERTGRVGLVGAAVSDHPDFARLAEYVAERGGSLALSSLRAENLNPGLLKILKATGLKSLTVAIEAGSEKLRAGIGKKVTSGELVRAAELARESGIRNFRIYARVGLPGEETGDVEELAALAVRARRALAPGETTLSVAPFVPKPMTPFQRERMFGENELTDRIRLLKRIAEPERVSVAAESPRLARVQGLFSRGGRSVGLLLADNPPQSAWPRIARGKTESGIIDGPCAPEDSLPWDFLKGCPDPAHLAREARAALSGKPPIICPGGDKCYICGICGRAGTSG